LLSACSFGGGILLEGKKEVVMLWCRLVW